LAQQRLWFLDQLDHASGAAYHMPAALHLQGRLNRAALKAALDRIVARHESLRTTFSNEGDQPTQCIDSPDIGFRLVEHDVRHYSEPERSVVVKQLGEAEAREPFDLAAGPLIRGQLLHLAEDEHVLLVTQHHIISDGWSLGVLVREVAALYTAFSQGQADPLLPLSLQYADYAVWQRNWLQGSVLHAQAEFWKHALEGAPAVLELPTDRPRPRKKDYAGGMVRMGWDASLTQKLKALSQRHGMTLYMTVLAAWAVVLSRMSGQDEVVIGVPMANRNRMESEGLIGFFVNTLAIRIAMPTTVAQLLDAVKNRALDANTHQDLPFEQVVELVNPPRSAAYTPIFQVSLAWQDNIIGRLNLPDLTLSQMNLSDHIAKVDLGLDMSEVDDHIEGGLIYATSLFDRGTIERYADYVRHTLEAMVSNDQQAIAHIDLLGDTERNLLLSGWNAAHAGHSQQGIALKALSS
jgi:hypothetical protein